MKRYVCSVCGYVYEEEKGIPGAGIPAGTKWEDLPDDWVCPLCGAGKRAFREKTEEAPAEKNVPVEAPEVERELSPMEMSFKSDFISATSCPGCSRKGPFPSRRFHDKIRKGKLTWERNFPIF